MGLFATYSINHAAALLSGVLAPFKLWLSYVEPSVYLNVVLLALRCNVADNCSSLCFMAEFGASSIGECLSERHAWMP